MDFARAVALAQRLILKNGRSLAVQKLSSTPADAAKPWKGPATPTVAVSETVMGVFVPHSSAQDLGKHFVDEELLKRCEQVVMVAGGTTNDLTEFHKIADEGTTWKIEWIRALKPGSILVLYVFGVKR